MSGLRQTGLIFLRTTLLELREPIWILVGLSTPLLYLILFSPLLKGVSAPGISQADVLRSFLPGILALLAFASGSAVGFSTVFELQAGVIERFRVTPASRFALLSGQILAQLAANLVFDLVLVLVGAAFGFQLHWFGLLVTAALISLLMATMSAFSVSVALLTRQISSFAAVINGLNLPVLLLAGVLLPISLGPTWMQVLAHFNPLYYTVSAARALTRSDFSSPSVWHGFAVMLPLCLLALTWATSVYRKAVA